MNWTVPKLETFLIIDVFRLIVCKKKLGTRGSGSGIGISFILMGFLLVAKVEVNVDRVLEVKTGRYCCLAILKLLVDRCMSKVGFIHFEN